MLVQIVQPSCPWPAWQAEAVTNPARPPPTIRTVNGSSLVTSLPPFGVSQGVRHQALLSSSPTSTPRRLAGSLAAASSVQVRIL